MGKLEATTAQRNLDTAALQIKADAENRKLGWDAAEGARRDRAQALKEQHEAATEQYKTKQLALTAQIADNKITESQRKQAQGQLDFLQRQQAGQEFAYQQQQRSFVHQSDMLSQRLSQQNQQIKGPDGQTLQGIAAAKAGLEDIDQLITAHPSVTSLANNLPLYDKVRKTLGGEDYRQNFETATGALRAAVIKAFGEGTRGYTKAGLEYNLKLIPEKGDTRGNARSKMEELGKNFDTRLKGVAMVNPNWDLSAWGYQKQDKGGGGGGGEAPIGTIIETDKGRQSKTDKGWAPAPQ